MPGSDISNTKNTKKIALGGILLTLTVVSVFFATIAPTGRLSLYALSSFFISIVVIESGAKSGWIFYISSCLLSLIVVQNRIGLIPYISFFGIYGLVKYYIEKINRSVPEYLLKAAFFSINLAIAVFLAGQVFSYTFAFRFPWWLAIGGLEIVFVVYDYVYTLFIRYYMINLKNKLKI